MIPVSYAETARDLFMDGYGCAQAVFTAFAPLLGLEQDAALKLSMGLGGGVGRMREVCGTVSGAAMVLGALYGGEDSRDKPTAYGKVRAFADAFRAQYGSIVCRELLGLQGASAPTPAPRTNEYYKKRPCKELVELSAGLLGEFIEVEK